MSSPPASPGFNCKAHFCKQLALGCVESLMHSFPTEGTRLELGMQGQTEGSRLAGESCRLCCITVTASRGLPLAQHLLSLASQQQLLQMHQVTLAVSAKQTASWLLKCSNYQPFESLIARCF